jgi:alcohol dehydrogenase class IV
MMSPHTFIHDTPRVVFGSQTLSNNILKELQHLNCSKPFILSTQSQSNHIQHITATLPNLVVGIYTNAALHTPIHVTEEALRLVENAGADCLVALGGGSPIGLSKALALRTNLPQIAIPTTYSGSEVLSISP